MASFVRKESWLKTVNHFTDEDILAALRQLAVSRDGAIREIDDVTVRRVTPDDNKCVYVLAAEQIEENGLSRPRSISVTLLKIIRATNRLVERKLLKRDDSIVGAFWVVMGD
ncbi:MAG TPA: hypothetical protein VFH06_03195 [Candidatus Saccharimonadales bacterium]|nr:hypothetical protein [Candidatus Saccharimonadales bacterium]